MPESESLEGSTVVISSGLIGWYHVKEFGRNGLCHVYVFS